MSFTVDPAVALGVLAGLTAVAAGISAMLRRRRKRALRALAGQWGMTFSSRDRLRITCKIAGGLPIAGAADVQVADVIYGAAGDKYRYVFTAEYTVGVVRGKRRVVRVGSFSEPRQRGNPGPAGPVVLAPEELSIIQQYHHLAR